MYEDLDDDELMFTRILNGAANKEETLGYIKELKDNLYMANMIINELIDCVPIFRLEEKIIDLKDRIIMAGFDTNKIDKIKAQIEIIEEVIKEEQEDNLDDDL